MFNRGIKCPHVIKGLAFTCIQTVACPCSSSASIKDTPSSMMLGQGQAFRAENDMGCTYHNVGISGKKLLRYLLITNSEATTFLVIVKHVKCLIIQSALQVYRQKTEMTSHKHVTICNMKTTEKHMMSMLSKGCCPIQPCSAIEERVFFLEIHSLWSTVPNMVHNTQTQYHILQSVKSVDLVMSRFY
jgi:hypothetical protein